MRLSLRLAAAALLAAGPAAAQTQLRLNAIPAGQPTVTVTTQATAFGPATGYVFSTTGNHTYYASPYGATLTLPGGATQQINVICADLLNWATVGQNFAVNVTALTGAPTLTTTRWIEGQQQQVGGTTAAPTWQTLTNAEALRRYRMASYLGAFMTTANQAQWDDIQLAIWKLTTPFTVVSTNATWTGTNAGTWLAQANAAADAGFVGVDFSTAYVYSDAAIAALNPGVQGTRADVGYQEFVTAARLTTPEPGTWALLASGLAGLALARRGTRRRLPR